MQDLSAKRTLVKSPPELWDELSEVDRLAKHLGAFGEIKITKLEPEHTVAWEGEHASGTVSIEPSGWGTKVILRAELAVVGEPWEPGAGDAGEPVADAGQTTVESGNMDVAAEEPTADVAEADVTAAAEEPPRAERELPQSEDADRMEGEPTDEVHSPVAEIPPAGALAFDAAGGPAIDTGSWAGADDRPRRRRGFWARLFAGWLVPEERLSRAASKPPTDTLPHVGVEPFDGTIDEPVVELHETSTEDPPPAEARAFPGALASEPPEADVEEAEPAGWEVEPRGADAEPEPVAESPSTIDPEGARAVLEATLDALGSAHHRPYSRG
jgi:hypothetical protein